MNKLDFCAYIKKRAVALVRFYSKGGNENVAVFKITLPFSSLF